MRSPISAKADHLEKAGLAPAFFVVRLARFAMRRRRCQCHLLPIRTSAATNR